MTAIVHHRKTCRLCDSKSIELIVKLKPIPLSENYCDDSETGKKAERYPIDLYMCQDCGHVQQLDVVNSEALWDNYSYFSSMANGMPEHFEDIKNEVVEKYGFPSGSLVFDIGSNDGSLLKPFKNAGYSVLGVDPAKEIAKQATDEGIPTIPELMSMDLAKRIKKEYRSASVITAFNVFAHTDDLSEMVNSIRELLAEDGVFIFEAQYLLDILDGMLIASIFHEHISHHSVKPLIKFFDAHGLELISIARSPIQHGSLIGTVQLKGSKRTIDESVGRLVELENSRALDRVETFYGFAEKIEMQKNKMANLIEGWKKENAVIAGFGAARSGPTLISQLGLTGAIDFIVDDHPRKVHKYSSGDGIYIFPTRELNEKVPDYTIILAWVHSEKIIANNKEYLEKGGKFVVLCPQMKIVSKNGTVII